MNIGFVAGLSDHKLAQKLAPLQAMPEVTRILLFRRKPFAGQKVVWHPIPALVGGHPISGDLWRMAQLLRHGKKCDLLVGCHQRFHGVMAAIAGKILSVPSAQLVITDFDLMWGHAAFQWVIRQAVLLGFRGRKARAKCLDRLASSPPVTFIPPNLFSSQTNAAPDSFESRDIDVLFIGMFTHDKNIPLLAKVLAGIKKRRGHLRACVIGQGPEKNQFQTELVRYGMTDDVMLLENQAHATLGNYYARSRLLLLPSRFEGLPMVVPEAMGWGTPVVTTSVGDLSEIISHGENGFLVASDDPDQLLKAAMRILDDLDLARRLSAAAQISHHRFAEASTLESAVGTWRTAFQELAHRHILPDVSATRPPSS